MFFEDLGECCILETYAPLLKVCRQGRETIHTARGEGEIVLGNNGAEIFHNCINKLYIGSATF
jgi:hypothetical protein